MKRRVWTVPAWFDALWTDELLTKSAQPLPPELAHLTQLMRALQDHIQDSELLPYRFPDWGLPPEQLKSRRARLLHRLFFLQHRILRLISPVRFLLIGLALLLPFIEPVYPAFVYALIRVIQRAAGGIAPVALTLPNVGRILLLFGLALALVLALAYVAVGGYWSFLAVARNRRVPRWTRAAIILGAVSLMALWAAGGAARVWDEEILTLNLRYDEFRDAGAVLGAVWHSRAYALASALLVYVPIFLLFSLLAIRAIVVGFVALAELLSWFFAINMTRDVAVVPRLVMTPLRVSDIEPPAPLLAVNPREIVALREWAECRVMDTIAEACIVAQHAQAQPAPQDKGAPPAKGLWQRLKALLR